MSTHPFIPLYVDDYDAATAHLTPEEDGVYMRLIRLCWRTPGCSVPNDPAWIARKIRLSAEDFARIAQPVIDEFFKVQRGRLVQRRLKAEYDDISRKKLSRQNAGKKGGEAKAAKTKDNLSSNASDLPADTRAFPEPEPYIDTPVVPKGTETPAKPSSVSSAEVDAIWALTPAESRRRSGKADLTRSLTSAMRRGRTVAAVQAGLSAYFASPEATKEGGAFVKGVHRMVDGDRWEPFVEQGATPCADPAYDRQKWQQRLDLFQTRNGYWPERWGPKPGEPNCEAPADLLPSANLFSLEARGAA